ncbi:MAG: type I DNA topoisomerase [Chloroflexi bacterium]|nr:type I DNA topoisomerase [Chloroflexota bacterium]
MEAYCVKCKTKREMQNPRAVFTAKGTPATKGTCPVCGTTLFRMGVTEAHAGLPRPEPIAPVAVKRAGKLVIVESPAKAKTVGRFLGKGYNVRASVGHIRDLLRSQLSVDVENDFAPKYRVPNEKRQVVKDLKADAARAEEIYLATDPDREGEAISWHLIEAAEIDRARVRRVVFHEITKPAIEEAFSHSREINMDLVNAQQARRILDRLVGYSLSPLLWAKVRGRLSAGRVQSVAVRLIVDREREIQAFVPEEYWSIEAELSRQGERSAKAAFIAKLIRVGDQEVELHNEAEVKPLLADLERSAYAVSKVKRGERRRNPSPPYTTSTMQQEASRRLGYTAKRTMSVAQQLYEGIDIDTGATVGLITYMRTDSTNVAEVAQKEVREYIGGKFGAEYLPPQPPQYKTKAKGAQEAHEAIRPTSAMREPKSIESFLSRDQFRLYNLVWQRFVASQMAAAVYDTVSVDIEARAPANDGGAAPPIYLLRVAGSTVRFPGFLAVYEEAREEDATADEEEGRRVPPLNDGDLLDLLRLIPEQHFTQPPPRYTEATLVRALEEDGIGRPSTYAPTLSTIQQRGYVVRVDKRLEPTDTGIVVNDLLVEHFADIVDIGFTARMEEDLDKIAEGEREWVPVLRDFYGPFAEQVKTAEAAMPKINNGPEYVGRDCPQTGHPLIIRWGRYGKFIGCSDFPNCRYTEPWLEKIGVQCPKDGGEIVERKTRKNRIFYGCANYPTCDFTSWKKPLPQPCPNCGGLLVAANRNSAQCTVCEQQTSLDSLVPEETQLQASAGS